MGKRFTEGFFLVAIAHHLAEEVRVGQISDRFLRNLNLSLEWILFILGLPFVFIGEDSVCF